MYTPILVLTKTGHVCEYLLMNKKKDQRTKDFQRNIYDIFTTPVISKKLYFECCFVLFLTIFNEGAYLTF